MDNIQSEVDRQKGMMDVSQGRLGTTENQAIKLMAEWEVFLMSKDEVAWRNNLKPSVWGYVIDAAGFGYGSLYHKVTKIGRLNIHVFGMNTMDDVRGHPFTSNHVGFFEIKTGRMSGKVGRVNKSCAFVSQPKFTHHRMGLSIKEYKEALQKYVTSNRGAYSPHALHEAWKDYLRNQKVNGIV